MDVLVCCTGNLCRSPMAEALLQQKLTVAGVSARVSSTGLLAPGRPADAGAVAAMASYGLDLSGHRSRVLDPAQVGAADLVVGMARQHVREIWLLDRAALDRTYTLKELVRRGEAVGPRGAEPLAGWLRRVGLGRRPADLVGEAPEDDVADPIGQSAAAFERVAGELNSLTTRLVALVAGGTQAPSAASAGSPEAGEA